MKKVSCCVVVLFGTVAEVVPSPLGREDFGGARRTSVPNLHLETADNFLWAHIGNGPSFRVSILTRYQINPSRVTMPPNQAEASSSTAGGAEAGKDRLWEFQLRRENKSILQEIRTAAKHREIDQVEFARQTKAASERLFALETKVAELEHARKEDEKAREKWMDDAAAFKSSMADFLSGRLSEGLARIAYKLHQ